MGSVVTPRPTLYRRQIVVRVDEELYSILAADAEKHGRTISQSVRAILRRAVMP